MGGGPFGMPPEIEYRAYRDENDLELVTRLVDSELSEPYSIFTYRYFMHQWPQLCILATAPAGEGGVKGEERCVGAIVCKSAFHEAGSRRLRAYRGYGGTVSGTMRGYIAMLVVDKPCRKAGVGSSLLRRAVKTMHEEGCEEVRETHVRTHERRKE